MNLLLVLSNPVVGREAEFHRWYAEQHLAEVLALPGFVAARRYGRVSPQALTRPSLPQQHLAIYEVQGSLDAAAEALLTAVGRREIVLPECIDQTSIVISAYAALDATAV